MKKYTFTLKNNNKTNDYMYNTFCTSSKPNYSKILDDLIAADVKKNNPWLYGYDTTPKETIKIKIKPITTEEYIFGDENIKLNTAFNFFMNLPKYCPFKKNTTYKLSNGDIIEITDDYIHINQSMYFFNLMDNNFFYGLSNSMKKTIATIYIDGLKITIKK